MNPNFFDHLFAILVLGLIFPIGGWWAWQRFLRHLAEQGEIALVREYQMTLVWQAALLAMPLLLWWSPTKSPALKAGLGVSRSV